MNGAPRSGGTRTAAPSNRLPRSVLAAALLAGIASSQTGRFESREYGFAVTPPSEGWQCRPAPSPTSGDVEFRLTLQRVGRGGLVGGRIDVAPATAGTTVDSMLARAMGAVDAGGSAYASVETGAAQLAGQAAAWLRADYVDPKQGEFVIRQHYLVANGFRYIIQCHAPRDEFADFETGFDAFVATFGLLELDPEAATARRRRQLAERCGTEADWAQSWSDAAARARATDRLLVVLVRRYPGFAIPAQMMQGPFMDTDVLELVAERFVPLRLQPGMDSPLASPANYGMSGTTFGNALMVVTPDGEVLAETHTTHPTACYRFLVDALAAHGPKAAMPAGADEIARAIRRGDLALAREALASPANGEEWALLADLRRRLRDADGAREALRRATASGAVSGPDAAGTEVRLAVAEGDADRARVALRRFRKAQRVGDSVADVLFWRAAVALQDGDTDDAARIAERLVSEYAEHRLAWRAAAWLADARSGTSLQPRWPDDQALRTLRTPEAAAPGAALATVERDAVRFLLDEQREDGSWPCPSEMVRSGPGNAFTLAGTALAGRSLLQRRESDAEENAVGAALDYVLRAHEHARTNEAKRSYMDYTVWSDSVAIWFLADCIDAGIGPAPELRRVVGEKVAGLAAKTRPSGGWSYYITGDLGRQGGVPPQAMSFTTAAVVLALLRARDVQTPVPDDLLNGALDCLQRARSEQTSAFAYMVGEGPSGPTAPPGAAGRGPLCELALHRAGRSSLERIDAALSMFAEHRRSYDAERGKVLMHAGAHGQGCHYLFFDYATAAEAVRELPESDRGPHRKWLLELILPARSVEGGFRDTPINGWTFGTAMALTALHALR